MAALVLTEPISTPSPAAARCRGGRRLLLLRLHQHRARHAQGLRSRIFQGPGSLLVQAVHGLRQVHLRIRPQGRADGSEDPALRRNDDPFRGQVQFHRQILPHRRILRHSANEEHVVRQPAPADQGRAVITADRLVDARRDALPRRPLLIEVDDVGFGEDRAAPGEGGRRFHFIGDAGELFDAVEIQPPRHVVQERAAAGRALPREAHFIHQEPAGGGVLREREELLRLPPHFDDGARLGMEQAAGGHDGIGLIHRLSARRARPPAPRPRR